MLLHLGGIKPFAPPVDASSTSAPFLPRLHRPRHGRAGLTTSSTAAITTTTREDRLPPSPMANAAAAPPDLLAHGDQDTDVPVQGARLLAEQLRSSSTEPVVYADLPRRAALVQPVPVHPVREPRRRDRRLRRLGHLTTGAADVQRPTSDLPGLTCSPTPHVTAGRLSGTCMYSSWDRRVTPAAC
jgi:hypothetical protein